MNTRKANLNKLRLPGAGNIQTRNGGRKATTDISNFFTPETNPGEWGNEVYSDVYSELMPSPIETLKNDLELPEKTNTSPRTKLSNLYPNEKRMKPAFENPTAKTKLGDFETQVKNVKKAPKTKAKSKARPKKQQKIKSAFLKSEELFSAVTAQHCLVDNVNPDDMQMALALSKSEADISGIAVEEDEAESKCKEEKYVIRNRLQKYGFRVAGTEDYNLTAFMPTKRKFKWGNKFTALTLRNATKQQEKVDKKIEAFLNMQLQSNDPPAENVVSYSVRSEVLLPMVADEDKRIVFWADSYEKENLENFYVLSLFEPSRTKVGHLLKDIRRIAGRDRSPVKGKLCERKHINTPVDPLLQSPAIKKSRYSKSLCPESLSVPCIEIDSVKTVQESIVSLPATVCSMPQCNDNLDSKVGTQKITASCPAATESITASRMIKSDCRTTIVSESSESLMNSSPSNASMSLSSSTNLEVLPMEIITPKTPTSSVGFLHTPFSSVRSASPDIFADSDVEMETGDCSESKNLNPNKSNSSEHQITTYEVYSSDEVKTSFSAVNDHDPEDVKIGVIDLTQCESESSTQQSEDIVPSIPVQSYGEKCLTDDILTTVLSLSPKLMNTASTDFQLSMETELTFPSNDEKIETPFCINRNIQLEKSIKSKEASFSFGSSASEELQRSSFLNKSLSKAEDSIDLTQNSDEELDCIVLSDDEVNYSIWKADKEGEGPVKEEPNTSVNRDSENNHEFSFIDLVTDTQPDPFVSQESDGFIRTNSNSSLDLLDLDLSKRSDFGILEEQSPFKTPTKTPIKTPKKTPRKTPANTLTKCRRALSDTFLASPVESSAPLKRFSSSKKFHEFSAKSDDDSLSDLDDIDKLIYGSPSKKVYKKPAGLDQLLTGPISTEISSSQKSEPELPKEFQFNGRTYLVRTVNISEKPNFEMMSEAALLDQLYRYGIKPLKRKQAIKILEYVYNQTHPHLVDEKIVSSQGLVEENSLSDNGMEISEDKNVAVGVSYSKFELKDCWGHNLVSEMDTFTEIKDEQYIVQTNTSKKISTALLPFHIAWYNLVKSNKQLHEAILHYEPIDLQEIYLFFKGLGYRYDPKELKYFFDSRSIIFRYDLNKSDPSAGANRHVRKKRIKLTQPKGKTKIS